MRVIILPKFDEGYASLSSKVKKKADKQLAFLLQNLRHPSLHAKKYDEANNIWNIWQARIDRSYRFYFKIEDDFYILIELCKHKF